MNKELKKIIDNNHIAVHLGMNVLCIEAYLKKYYPSHEWPKYAHILWGFLGEHNHDVDQWENDIWCFSSDFIRHRGSIEALSKETSIGSDECQFFFNMFKDSPDDDDLDTLLGGVSHILAAYTYFENNPHDICSDALDTVFDILKKHDIPLPNFDAVVEYGPLMGKDLTVWQKLTTLK